MYRFFLGSVYYEMNFSVSKLMAIVKLGDNTFVIEWFAGINCIILWSQI